MSDHLIEIKNLCKDFGGEPALKNISFYIRDNEFVTLLGPSGCGKTTLLRILGGFESSDSGSVEFAGKDLLSLPAYKREINTVFQKYALFPHLNVYDNVAFGLKIQKCPKSEIGVRVKAMLKLVGLSGYEKRSIDSLSGGQQQRISIARALVNRPKVLLLDEPLGALDLKLRKEMQLELKTMQRSMGITFLYVTHDQEEALTMSDTIIVLKEGEIMQIGKPVDIYNEPKNAFVADFIGESNITEGVMPADYSVQFCGCVFECLDAGFAPNQPVDVVVRPEDVKVVPPEKGQLSGSIQSVLFMGVHNEVTVDCGDFTFLVHTTATATVGQQVGLLLLPDDIHIMHKSKYQPEAIEEEVAP